MKADHRVGRTEKLLHRVLISLILENKYDSITIQEILDRADIGRSTFYAHFKSKDELLISGIHDLRDILESAIQSAHSRSKPHENVIGFSLAMFQHAGEYREVYHALLPTHGWPIFRQCLEEMFGGRLYSRLVGRKKGFPAKGTILEARDRDLETGQTRCNPPSKRDSVVRGYLLGVYKSIERIPVISQKSASAG